MRLLMLSPTLPWPLTIGSKIRIYYVLRELARAGLEVTLLALAHDPYGPGDLDPLRTYCSKLHVIPAKNRPRAQAAWRAFLSRKPYGVAKFDSPAFRKAVTEALHKEDYPILWVHFMETLIYLPSDAGWKKSPLVVLDQHNADERFWETYAREGSPWVRLFAKFNLWQLRRFQASVLNQVDVVLSVSKEDADFTQAQLTNPATQVWIVPNGVDTERLQPLGTTERRNRIIFCGAMDVFMNIDAVNWFARRMFPRVREAVPDAEFWIVGRNPNSKVKALASLPGVRVIGQVEDVRPYYAEAKVAVAPFRYGGGTKLKVLEAMALGVPVVATPVGCQGIEAVPGKHLFKEENEEAFTERVVNLLQDDSLRLQMAIEARKLVEDRYSWHSIMHNTIEHLELMIRDRPG
jgi:sugar transferase (PEP-CTERM/EpsH1 system associated)